jgi:hypothetical protein
LASITPSCQARPLCVLHSGQSDMTIIHWKAFEEHFLMVPLFFRFTHFFGEKYIFLIFLKKFSPYDGLIERCPPGRSVF